MKNQLGETEPTGVALMGRWGVWSTNDNQPNVQLWQSGKVSTRTKSTRRSKC
jgi:hypothetical protein